MSALLALEDVEARYGPVQALRGISLEVPEGAVVAVLLANGSVVLPSTLDPASSLTRESAAATPGALGLITAFGAVAVPGVVVYQVWSYWVFRRRVASERVRSTPVCT